MKIKRILRMLAIIAILSASQLAFAGATRIVDVKVECNSSCTFSVTLQHADTGWDHYANQWDVVTLDGVVLGTRVLYHPHVNEQPFTRSLSGVKIPTGTRTVKIRAKDSVHGYATEEYTVQLP
jgi:hypothetical protein